MQVTGGCVSPWKYVHVNASVGWIVGCEVLDRPFLPCSVLYRQFPPKKSTTQRWKKHGQHAAPRLSEKLTSTGTLT